MVGYVFLTTNSKTGKKLIGKRLSVGFDKNYFGDNSELQDDIAKYGVSGLSVSMLMPYESIEAVDAGYEYFLKEYNAKSDKSFYNCESKVDADTDADVPQKKTRKKKVEQE